MTRSQKYYERMNGPATALPSFLGLARLFAPHTVTWYRVCHVLQTKQAAAHNTAKVADKASVKDARRGERPAIPLCSRSPGLPKPFRTPPFSCATCSRQNKEQNLGARGRLEPHWAKVYQLPVSCGPLFKCSSANRVAVSVVLDEGVSHLLQIQKAADDKTCRSNEECGAAIQLFPLVTGLAKC